MRALLADCGLGPGWLRPQKGGWSLLGWGLGLGLCICVHGLAGRIPTPLDPHTKTSGSWVVCCAPLNLHHAYATLNHPMHPPFAPHCQVLRGMDLYVGAGGLGYLDHVSQLEDGSPDPNG